MDKQYYGQKKKLFMPIWIFLINSGFNIFSQDFDFGIVKGKYELMESKKLFGYEGRCSIFDLVGLNI